MINPVKLEQFTNWLTQEILSSPTRSVVVKNGPRQLNMCGAELDEALKELRARDVIACSNGRWWLRDVRAAQPLPLAKQLTQAVVESVAPVPAKRRVGR